MLGGKNRQPESRCIPFQAAFGLFNNINFFDFNGLQGHIAMPHFVARARFGDFIDHIHALAHFAKHGIAVVLIGGRGVIERRVVGNVDEKLAGSGMRSGGARHGDCADCVFQAVGGFVSNRRIGGFLQHIGREAATLNHKAVDYAVENGAVIKAFVGIVHKIGHRFGGFLFVQAQFDVAQTGFNNSAGFGLCGEAGGANQRGQQDFLGDAHWDFLGF